MSAKVAENVSFFPAEKASFERSGKRALFAAARNPAEGGQAFTRLRRAHAFRYA